MLKMGQTDVFHARSGWTNINSGAITSGRLKEWIKDYFNVDENLTGFFRRNEIEGIGLEICASDFSRGYVFVGELQLDRDYEERRMQKSKRLYIDGRGIGMLRIGREFIDHNENMAGFSWEKI
jgi:hypothetical protein